VCMEYKMTCEHDLYSKLVRVEIDYIGQPLYNNYRIEQLGEFQLSISKSKDSFEEELQNNLVTDRSDIYLKSLLEKYSNLYNQITEERTWNFKRLFEDNPDIYRANKLQYLKAFIDFQIQVIEDVYNDLAYKLKILPGVGPVITSKDITEQITNDAPLGNKYDSDLSFINLTSFWILACECGFVKLESMADIARWVSNNFRYNKNGVYTDIKFETAKSLISKLYNPEQHSEASLPDAQEILSEELIDAFQKFKDDVLEKMRTKIVSNAETTLTSNKKRLR
jgi:hypothetical protein